MRLWPFSRKSAQPPAESSRVLFSWAPGPWLPGGTYVGTSSLAASRVSREEALSVVGVKRGRDLLCSIATLPLEQRNAARERTRSVLLEQIDPDVPNIVTLAMTVEDLLFESASWWEIKAFDRNGFPASARHVDYGAVSMFPPQGYPISTLPSGLFPNGVVWINGSPVGGENIIRFDSPNGPLLVHGANAIRRAVNLARAAEMHTKDPEARAFWRPTEGVDPARDEYIEDMLRKYVAARNAGVEAYIPFGMERVPIDIGSPADLQLVELQRRSDLEIANLMGLDPEDLGISTTTRTYSNATDRRQDRLNNVLSMFIQAITHRLSMNDVTRRGYRVTVNLDEYLRADPATRWNTYGVALDREVKTVQEVRAEEGLPAIPVEPRSADRTPVETRSTARIGARFTSGPMDDPDARTADSMTFTFDSAEVEGFAASSETRTVSGMVMPYGPIGQNWSGKWRFAPGSIHWNDSAPGRVKLNRDHFRSRLLGSATDLQNKRAGVFGKFSVAKGSEGDEALSLAEDGHLDGLSAEVEIEEYSNDPKNEGVFLVTSAKLTGTALTAYPGFDDARLTKVAASATRTKGIAMRCQSCGFTHPANFSCPTPAPTPAPAPTPTPEPTPTPAPDATFTAEDLGRLAEAFTASTDAFTAAVNALRDAMPDEQRRAVNPVPVATVREPLVYSLTGLGDSFVRDAWHARHAPYGSQVAEDAQARLRKYEKQTAEIAERAAQRFANAGNTTDQAEIIPPGYRPDLYVGQVPQGRPWWDSIGTKVMLANATPFKVPVWVGSSGLSGTNTEGTGPSTGTITDHTYRTVTPTAQSGEFVVTRELMDSANPVIDVIALTAMREEYAQDTEAVITAAVAAATDNDTGSGQSTEGCYVYTVTGTGADLAIEGIRLMEAEFTTHRFIAPDRMLSSPTGFSALTRAVDDVGRPLFPFVGAQNALGTVGRVGQALNIDGLAVPNAWAMTSTYDDVVLFNSVDVLAGESTLLQFRFEEKGGPENIYLNIWGYFCFQILRYTGIHACNYTAV